MSVKLDTENIKSMFLQPSLIRCVVFQCLIFRSFVITDYLLLVFEWILLSCITKTSSYTFFTYCKNIGSDWTEALATLNTCIYNVMHSYNQTHSHSHTSTQWQKHTSTQKSCEIWPLLVNRLKGHSEDLFCNYLYIREKDNAQYRRLRLDWHILHYLSIMKWLQAILSSK